MQTPLLAFFFASSTILITCGVHALARAFARAGTVEYIENAEVSASP